MWVARSIQPVAVCCVKTAFRREEKLSFFHLMSQVCRYLDSSGRYWLGYLNGNYCKVASARDGKAYQKSVHYTIASILCSKP